MAYLRQPLYLWLVDQFQSGVIAKTRKKQKAPDDDTATRREAARRVHRVRASTPDATPRATHAASAHSPPPPHAHPLAGCAGPAGDGGAAPQADATSGGVVVSPDARCPPPLESLTRLLTCTSSEALAAAVTSARSVWSAAPGSTSTGIVALFLPQSGIVSQERCDLLVAEVGGRRLDAAFIVVDDVSVVEGQEELIYPFAGAGSGTIPLPDSSRPTLVSVCQQPLVWDVSIVGYIHVACYLVVLLLFMNVGPYCVF
eukprot:TRINITY_DN4470_c0_g1_i2.p1 TRINITY_DN4470_c0_g1~~TRINITY_DN4470_c0_g1_i2.p1  ORF type:complete len:257 (-),score=13.14 TRINITY_DN4470_c0_g1_i2:514-1284(-)